MRTEAHTEPAAATYDVVIVGGGMVGASLALALAGSPVRVLLVESVAPASAAQPSFDDRTTALGNASRRIFEALGVWPVLAPEAGVIRAIHVSDAGRFGFARLDAAEQGVDAFGYVVPNRAIGAALWQALASAGNIARRVPARNDSIRLGPGGAHLTLVDDETGARETLSAQLVVAADGAHSSVRAAAGIEAAVEDYDQVAIVANVAADKSHDGTAYERFTPAGPLAVLPLRDGSYTVVWSARPAEAQRLLGAPDGQFVRELQSCFGWRAGRFTRAGRRSAYPLRLTRAVRTVATRSVLIGNAAQALHPVAGQGFNLGLRDAAMLAEVIAGAARESGESGTRFDAGSPELLARFETWRAGDRGGVTRFTDGLIRLFGDTRRGIGLARDLGLLLFDLMPPAKSALARVSVGFTGPAPRLARGLRAS